MVRDIAQPSDNSIPALWEGHSFKKLRVLLGSNNMKYRRYRTKQRIVLYSSYNNCTTIRLPGNVPSTMRLHHAS